MPLRKISLCYSKLLFFSFIAIRVQKIQWEGIQEKYCDPDDETIQMQTHMMLALSFVPEDKIRRVFDLLRDEVDGNLLLIFDYFGETHVIGRVAQSRCRAVAL